MYRRICGWDIVYKWLYIFILTHWGRYKMAAILQTTFSNAFSWMKMYELRLKFHGSLFLGVQLIITQHWCKLWHGADQATSHYLNQWWLVSWCIYASLCLNELIHVGGLVHDSSIYIAHQSYHSLTLSQWFDASEKKTSGARQMHLIESGRNGWYLCS